MSGDFEDLLDRLCKEMHQPHEMLRPVLAELDHKGWIDEYDLRTATGFEDLKDDVREELYERGLRSTPRARPGRKPQILRESFEVPMSEYVETRTRALSLALVEEAAKLSAVERFRSEVLDGKLLSSGAARQFVKSPAVRYFWFEWFREWNISPVEHQARVVVTAADVPQFHWGARIEGWLSGFNPYEDAYYVVRVDPLGVEKGVLYGSSSNIDVPEGLKVDEEYFFNYDPEDPSGQPSREKRLRFLAEDAIDETYMLPGSLLDDLRRLADLLSGRYGWSQEDAVAFVLTGREPSLRTLEVNASLLTGYENSPPVWTIGLEAAPWVPVEEVVAAYREVQLQVLKGSSGKGRLAPRRYALYSFVKEQRLRGDDPSWNEMLDSWNSLYPEGHGWHYPATKIARQRKSNFKRDYENAEEALLRSDYQFPRRKVTTQIEQWRERDVEKRRKAAEAEIEEINAYLKLLPGSDDRP